MEEKDIDRLFKAEHQNESMIPPKFVWEDIERDLKKDKKRKRLFVWIVVGLVLLTAFLYYQSRNILKNEMPLQDELTNVKPQSGKQFSHEATVVDSQLKHEETGSAKTVTNEIIKEDYNDQLNEQNNQWSAQKEIINLISNPSTIVGKQATSNSIIDGIPNVSDIDSQDLSKNAIKENQVSQTNKINFSGLERESKFEREKEEAESIGAISILLPSFERELKDLELDMLEIDSKEGIKSNSIAIQFHLGRPIFNVLTQDAGNESPESDWYSYGIDVNYFKKMTHKFYFGAGINVSQSKRKFNYQSDDLLLRESSSANASFEYGKLISAGEQRFSFIDFSLNAKYDIWKRKMKISLGLSAIYNVRLDFEGKTLDNNEKIVRYKKEDNLYQSSLGLGISPSISLSIPWGENMHFIVTPRFVTFFSNIRNENQMKEMKYSNFGLNFGLSRRF